MSINDSTFSPDEFRATAAAAVAACAGRDLKASARRLAADGLLGVLASETVGGLGLPLQFAVPIAEQAGAGLLAFPLIETLLLARVAKVDVARRIIAGEEVATVLWRGGVEASGGGTSVVSGDADRGPLVGYADVAAVQRDGGGAVVLPVRGAGKTVDASTALALDAPDGALSVERVQINPDMTVTEAAWQSLKRDALILKAAAILGSAEHCLTKAAEHVGTRRQFGSTLVSNQAVRHIMARHKLGLEGVRSAIGRHFYAPTDLSARAAFAHACTTGIATAEGAIQLHGGMGFTWDVPLHRHLRQIRTLALHGDHGAVLEAMATDLIDKRNTAEAQ
jgi:alkylation response protein AidB-like acyl-CoA dehydrogenase